MSQTPGDCPLRPDLYVPCFGLALTPDQLLPIGDSAAFRYMGLKPFIIVCRFCNIKPLSVYLLETINTNNIAYGSPASDLHRIALYGAEDSSLWCTG